MTLLATNDDAWAPYEREAENYAHGHSQTVDRWRKAMPLLDLSAWSRREPPEQEWALRDWMPARQATYLTGPGSAGKSLLTQQLCTCVALGIPFMGVETRQAPALYVTCEDDADTLERRQKTICEALGVDRAAIVGKLHLVSLAGHTGTELATFGHTIERDELGQESPTMRTTPQWSALSGTAKAIGAKFIGLDNVAHLFAGNENIRNEVAGFVSLLNRLAMETGGAVLFIGHPNKAGDSFSGSTAWENQVRSRLFLETPKDADGNVLDADARVLSRQKSNYARNGESLAFRWHNMAFVRDEDLPTDARAEMAANSLAATENQRFLSLLAKATADRRAVSHVNGSNYAPRVFAKMIEAKGMKEQAFAAALERLLHLGTIQLDQPLWQDAHRHWRQGIKLAEKCGNPPAPTPCGDPRQPPSQVVDIVAATLRAATPLYTTYKPGAALGEPAPDPEDIVWDDGQ